MQIVVHSSSHLKLVSQVDMAKEITTKPEHMLPIMIVLGIMFIGICIAMNLFSR